MPAVMLTCTVRSVGEAPKKSSSREARNLSGELTDRSSETRFGKTKWLKNDVLCEYERRRSDFRFTALLRRGGEGEVPSESSRPSLPQTLILRVCNSGSGPGLASEKFRMSLQSQLWKSRDWICSVREESIAIVVTGML